MNTLLNAAKSIADIIARSLKRRVQIGTALCIGAGVLPGTTPFIHATCQQGCDIVNQNTFLGEDALVNNTSGPGDTAVGFQALLNNTTGQANTALGLQALTLNTDGFGNTATGWKALFSNTTGAANTGCGEVALYSNTTGENNTAVGAGPLISNTTGSNNTSTGTDSLRANTTGSANTAIGVIALAANISGNNNTAAGLGALQSNTIGNNNTSLGYNALELNTTANNNTALGNTALGNNTTGASNIAVGNSAGANLTTGSNNIDIGNAGKPGESARIRIGTTPIHKNTFVAGIYGVTIPSGIGVVIDGSGHLGTVTSSKRFKEEIKPIGDSSDVIFSLEPVKFHYKKKFDSDGIPQFGLVAEQVEKIDPELVVHDDAGKPYTVRYDAVNAMLLNEFLKEHRKVEEQATALKVQANQQATLLAEVTQLKGALGEQSKTFEARVARQEEAIALLASQVQGVSASLQGFQPVRVATNH